MQSDEELLNRAETSKFTGLAKGTMDKLRVYGGGPRFIKLGRRVLYSRQDLIAFVHSHRRNSTSDPGAAPLAPQK